MANSTSNTTAADTLPGGEKKTVVGGKGKGRLRNAAYRTRKHLMAAEAIADAAEISADHTTG